MFNLVIINNQKFSSWLANLLEFNWNNSIVAVIEFNLTLKLHLCSEFGTVSSKYLFADYGKANKFEHKNQMGIDWRFGYF